jgi:hypothetical protein
VRAAFVQPVDEDDDDENEAGEVDDRR